MKTFLRRWCGALALVLCAFALPATAAEAVKLSNKDNAITFRDGAGHRGRYGYNGGSYSDSFFDGNFTSGFYQNGQGCEVVVPTTHIVTDPNGQPYVTEVKVGHVGNTKYSLYYTTEEEPADILTYAKDPRTWTPIDGAQGVQEAGTKTFNVNQVATAVKYVFDTVLSWTASACEFEVWGYEYVPAVAVKMSNVGRSITFRDGAGHRGSYGFNGGSYSDGMFDGNFTSGLYQNGQGAELVVPTTGLDPDDGTDTGVAWYVTEVKVGHVGNTKYSLYYTTEAEPADILSNTKDPRTWTLIDGASQVQEAGTKTYNVNKNATAVKYVFDTVLSWTASACEFEVWAMDPATISCLHENLDLATATWTVCTPATCTQNAIEETFCPDCGERFEREAPLTKLGHDFVATLTTNGTATAYGSGYVECSRCNEFHIEFAGDTVDLTTLGGPPINGVVQYTDLTVSSIGAQDGGIKAVYLMDNAWTAGWGGAFYFETCSSNEWAQYAFGTTIDLTKIEYSVINEYQTVYFSKYDPATGEETLLRTIPIEKDTSDGAPGYLRKTEMFFGEGDTEHVFVDAVRMRIGDYVDPETGAVTAYRGFNYGAHDRHTIICEVHPWGTIAGAGMTAAPVAMIGDSSYMSVAAAIASITNDTPTTIVLQKSTTEDVVIPTNRTVTINLNGNSITNDASDTITVYGTLTLQDAAGHGEVVALGEGNAAVLSTNSVAIASGTYRGGIEAADGGTFSISGGWFDMPLPVEYAAEGKAPTTVPENGLYTVKTARTVTFNLGAEAADAVYTNLVVATGEAVAEPEDPTLEGYTFNEWRLNDAAYDFTAAVSANLTLVANWTTNQYDVLWMSDGALFASNRLDYGAAIVAPDPAPAKAADAQYTYWFAGWTPEPDATVSNNATYTAVYTNTVNQYTVTFSWHDGSLADDYDYGTPAADVAVPRDPPSYVDNGTIYTFTGWDASVADVTGAATYTAQYAGATAVAEVLTIANDGATTNSVGTYASLRAAIDAAPAGSTVVLLADDRVSFSLADLEICISTALTIDGAGHTVYGVNDYNSYDATTGGNDHDIFITRTAGDVTIKNLHLTEFGGAAYVSQQISPLYVSGAYAGTFTLDNVTIDKFNRHAMIIGGGTAVVTNCTITGDAPAPRNAKGAYFQEGIEVYYAAVTVSDTSITGMGAYDPDWEDSNAAAAIQLTSSGSITVDGGTYSGQFAVMLYEDATGSVALESGDFTGVLDDGGSAGSIVVNGGTFDRQVPVEFAGAGLAPTTVAEGGKYTVKTAYEVTFKTDSETVYTNTIVAAGETVAAPDPAPTKADFDFTGWFADGSDTAFDFANTPIVADIELTAGWESSFVPPTPVQINIGAGLADYVPAEGETVPAPVAVENGAMKVSFVAPVDGTYMLCVATAVDGEYADDANTAEEHKAGDLVTLEYEIPAGDTAPARFFKIGFNQ